MNTKLRLKAKNNFEKDFFKLMNNAVFGKTMGNKRKHISIRLVIAERRNSYLVSDTQTTNFFYRKCINNRNQKSSNINEQFCVFRFTNIKFKKTIIYEFQYDFVKPRYDENE